MRDTYGISMCHVGSMGELWDISVIVLGNSWDIHGTLMDIYGQQHIRLLNWMVFADNGYRHLSFWRVAVMIQIHMSRLHQTLIWRFPKTKCSKHEAYPKIIQVIGYDQWENQWFGVANISGNLHMSTSEWIKCLEWSWSGIERLDLMFWRTW